MPSRIYSRPFIIAKGVTDDSHQVTVPVGHVYVVRAVAWYAHTVLETIDFALKCFTTDSVLIYRKFNPAGRDSDYFDVHIAFLQGETFGFASSHDILGDGVDAYCGGYDLLAPTA